MFGVSCTPGAAPDCRDRPEGLAATSGEVCAAQSCPKAHPKFPLLPLPLTRPLQQLGSIGVVSPSPGGGEQWLLTPNPGRIPGLLPPRREHPCAWIPEHKELHVGHLAEVLQTGKGRNVLDGREGPALGTPRGRTGDAPEHPELGRSTKVFPGAATST